MAESKSSAFRRRGGVLDIRASGPNVCFRPIADIRSFSDQSNMRERPDTLARVELPALKMALEASWDHLTSYQGVLEIGNPALGQCYPTARVVQWFYPDYEIAKGDVWTGSSLEQHFWNVRGADSSEWLDLSWQQFPRASTVRAFAVLDRENLGDSERARQRCDLLLNRVVAHLRLGLVAASRI